MSPQIDFEFIEKLRKYYSYIDVNFFEEFYNASLPCKETIVDSDHLSYPFLIAIKEAEINRKFNREGSINPNSIISRITDFFFSMDETHGRMALQLLLDSNTDIHIGDPMNSKAYDLLLSKKLIDIPTACHEIAHMFSFPKRFSDRKSNLFDDYDYSPISILLSEIPAFVCGFLACDYVKQHMGRKVFGDDILINIINLTMKQTKQSEQIELQKLLSEDDEEDKKNRISSLVSSHFVKGDYSAEFTFDSFMGELSHDFGFMVACFVYKKMIEDPQNIKMYLGVMKALSIAGDESTTLRFLEAIGLPCFKDGKILLDDESRNLLTDATQFVLEKCFERENASVPLSKSKPLIKPQYYDEVNGLYESVSKKHSIVS